MNFIEYVKQIWKNGPGGGTPWSAARLNHMEDGIKNNNSMISELNNNITFYSCFTKILYRKAIVKDMDIILLFTIRRQKLAY